MFDDLTSNDLMLMSLNIDVELKWMNECLNENESQWTKTWLKFMCLFIYLNKWKKNILKFLNQFYWLTHHLILNLNVFSITNFIVFSSEQIEKRKNHLFILNHSFYTTDPLMVSRIVPSHHITWFTCYFTSNMF